MGTGSGYIDVPGSVLPASTWPNRPGRVTNAFRWRFGRQSGSAEKLVEGSMTRIVRLGGAAGFKALTVPVPTGSTVGRRIQRVHPAITGGCTRKRCYQRQRGRVRGSK
eukprot:gene8775-biopygen117